MNTAPATAAAPARAGGASVFGDARSGKLSTNVVAFGRALRRAGVRIDPARMALAQQALQCIDLGRRDDVAYALEAVLVQQAADRAVFRELFHAFFRDPALANKLLSQLLPEGGKAEPTKQRARVREALAPQKSYGQDAPKPQETEVKLDAAMSASDQQVLRQADFNAMTASEFALMQRLVRQVPLPVPQHPARRLRPAERGARLHWPGALQQAVRHGGELARLPRLQRRQEPLPLLVLIDVSGSMERYARMLLAFLHAATQHLRRREVFAFGTHLSPLKRAFDQRDPDVMLDWASRAITDFAGGTRLGESLAQLRAAHPRSLVGRRTLVLLVSDGLDTGDVAQLQRELLWLKRHSRRLLWLNPLLRFAGYKPTAQGAALLHSQADAMVAVHNLAKLHDLAKTLADVMRR